MNGRRKIRGGEQNGRNMGKIDGQGKEEKIMVKKRKDGEKRQLYVKI